MCIRDSIYGAPLPEGITYKTEGITEAVIPPQSPEYVYVSEWPEGYRETDITARDGYRATAYRYKYKDGELVETEKLYTDNYNPVRGKICLLYTSRRLSKGIAFPSYLYAPLGICRLG